MLCDSKVHNIKVCTVSCKYFVTATLQQYAYNSEVQHLFFIYLQILFSVLLYAGNLACHWLIMRRKEIFYFEYFQTQC